MSRKINNVLTWLESSAEKFPNKTVFADETDSVTYAEFTTLARSLGTAIAERTPPRTPVAVLGNKTVDTLVAFFACVYAGCFYVPLNPAHPAARRARILETLGAPLVVVCAGEEKTAESIVGCPLLRTSEGKTHHIDGARLEDIARGAIDVDPLYVIFTSGSTGDPKGIAVSHRSVVDFIEEFTDIFAIDCDEVLANQAPFDFDVSVKDIYSTVRAGATLQIIPKRMFSFPMMLIDFMCERKVTTLVWAVSAMCILSGFRAFSYRTPDTVKKVLFSGEAMPVKHLDYWRKSFPDATFVNLYGPTEITCNCAYYIIDKDFDGAEIPIGKPFPNERVALFDGDREIAVTEANAIGEICVSGTALSLGYYNNPDATEKAFVRDPRICAYMQRMYKTGDMGYYGGDGLLYFCGRRDFQIKYMGHRIELGEIERAIEQVHAVSRAVCIFDNPKQKLYAFYIGDATAEEIATHLREKLPAFMIPSRIVQTTEFPLTENGKIDRKKLAEAAHVHR